jgi:hypothetical protein
MFFGAAIMSFIALGYLSGGYYWVVYPVHIWQEIPFKRFRLPLFD